jgi:hypothetical protein
MKNERLIISASRRTDIPAFYSSWFMNRVHEGWCLVPNPINYDQLSFVSLKPDDVDAIVFWSKNPSPMISYLRELDKLNYRYYFQFTVNDYPDLLEPHIPNIEYRIQTFRELSSKLELERIVWRYDPIIISNYTSYEFHRNSFSNIATALEGYTRRVMVSFVDYYNKTNLRLASLEREGFRFDKEAASSVHAWELMEYLQDIATSRNMEIFTCAEERDYSGAGVPPGRCIDGNLLYRLWSLDGHCKKDPSQREACLCAISKDIGINDTCGHGCAYCYSTRNFDLALRRNAQHSSSSPVIWGKTRELSEAEISHQLSGHLL